MENEVEVRGPPVSKAFDKEGNPTKVEWIEFCLLFYLVYSVLQCALRTILAYVACLLDFDLILSRALIKFLISMNVRSVCVC